MGPVLIWTWLCKYRTRDCLSDLLTEIFTHISPISVVAGGIHLRLSGDPTLYDSDPAA